MGHSSFREATTVLELPGSDCEIRMGRGIANVLHLVPDGYSKIAVLTQPAVATLAADLAEQARVQQDMTPFVREMPDGEAAKQLSVVEEVYEWLNTIGFTRGDLVVGVGGGALTDVAGFAAATYLRGVDVVYLPTTLLGAVDASIGGKTGVNVGGKNLAGVFRHPRRVVVDLDILDTVPQPLRVEGSAEVVKAGFIDDPTIVAAYEVHGAAAPLEDVVPAAIAVKIRAVSADFREEGRRTILNYGHTVGHAIEVAAEVPHGHAVAIGMVAAGKIAEEMVGFADAARQREVIEGIGLPVVSPRVDIDRVQALMARDKKRDGTGLRMVLLEEIGKPVVRHVPPDLLRAGLDAIGVESR